MKRRKLAWTIGVVALGGLAVIAATFFSDHNAGDQSLQAAPPSKSLITRGEYLARLGDCAACHSVAGRPAFTGGLPMHIPIGTIYSTNITFDDVDGIGTYSLSDFDKAIRFGVSHGHTLYPAMPFASYANLKPDDVQALYAYFKYGVPASATPNMTNSVPFPLSLRFPLTMWRWLYAPPPKPFDTAPHVSPEIANGEYFVEGLGHCGECHTPRGVAMQVQAQTAADGAKFLSGTDVESWFAPSLRSDGDAGTLRDWNVSELAAFLRTGANNRGIAFGSMNEVIEHSTQYMTEQDATDTATFLKSLSGGNASQPFVYSDGTDKALRNGDTHQRGSLTYLDSCAACHRPDGKGYDRVFPALAGNPVVNANDPTSLISIVLAGSHTTKTPSTPAQFAMPAFASRLSDQDVADVVTFIRSSWGNTAAPVSADNVSPLRKAASHP